ncbi:FHA domain-containing protein, partial [Georgenia thermotolerans]
MSELVLTLLRVGYLVLLWGFVLAALAVLRRDIFGTRVTPRGPGRPTRAPRNRRPAAGGAA